MAKLNAYTQLVWILLLLSLHTCAFDASTSTMSGKLDTPTSFPANEFHHHAVVSSLRQILHFPRLRQEENLQKKRERFFALCEKKKEKKLKNLTALNNFPQCCCRYKLVCHARSISTIKINKRRLSYRKCVNGVIPQKLLADARNNFLNLVSREARKSFIKSLRTPTKRLFVLFIWFVAPVY